MSGTDYFGGVTEEEFPVELPKPLAEYKHSHLIIQKDKVLFRAKAVVCEFGRNPLGETKTTYAGIGVEIAGDAVGVVGLIRLEELRQVVSALTEFEKCFFNTGTEGMSGKTSTPCPDLSNAQ